MHRARARTPPATGLAVQAPRPRRPSGSHLLPGTAQLRVCPRRLGAVGLSGSAASGRPYTLGGLSPRATPAPSPRSQRRESRRQSQLPLRKTALSLAQPAAGKVGSEIPAAHFVSLLHKRIPQKVPSTSTSPLRKTEFPFLGETFGNRSSEHPQTHLFSPVNSQVWCWSVASRFGRGAALTPCKKFHLRSYLPPRVNTGFLKAPTESRSSLHTRLVWLLAHSRYSVKVCRINLLSLPANTDSI